MKDSQSRMDSEADAETLWLHPGIQPDHTLAREYGKRARYYLAYSHTDGAVGSARVAAHHAFLAVPGLRG